MVLFAQMGGTGPWRAFVVESLEVLESGEFEVIRSDHPDIPACDEAEALVRVELLHGPTKRYQIVIAGVPAVALVVVGEPKATEPEVEDRIWPPMPAQYPNGCVEPAIILLAVVMAGMVLAARWLFA